MSDTKPCTQCGLVLPLDRFGSRGGSDRPRSYCKSCAKAYRDRPEVKARYKELTSSPEYLATRRQRYDPEKQKYDKIRFTYNLSQQQYDAMHAAQDGVCAICSKEEPLVVDHDHSCCPGHKSCGKCVRGLLCNNCNNGLGRFSDNEQLLEKAKEYVITKRQVAAE